MKIPSRSALSHRSRSRILLTREEEVGRLRAVLERAHTPRFDMALIVALTAGAGLLASFLLLNAGLLHMGWRYLAALGVAYLVFLFLLWLWLRLRQSDFDVPDPGVGDFGGSGSATRPVEGAPEPFTGEGGHFGGGGASSGFDGTDPQSTTEGAFTETASETGKSVVEGLGGIADAADEAAIPLVLIGVLVALLVGVFVVAGSIIVGAPALFAELLVDGALAGGLYRRLRKLDPQHWLEVALKRTAAPFLVVALVTGAIGFGAQSWMPEAHTLGQVIGQAR